MVGSYVRKHPGSKRIKPPDKTAFLFYPLTSIVSIFFGKSLALTFFVKFVAKVYRDLFISRHDALPEVKQL